MKIKFASSPNTRRYQARKRERGGRVQLEDVCPVTIVLTDGHLEEGKEKKKTTRIREISTSERATIKDEEKEKRKKLFCCLENCSGSRKKGRKDGWSDILVYRRGKLMVW